MNEWMNKLLSWIEIQTNCEWESKEAPPTKAGFSLVEHSRFYFYGTFPVD